MSSSTLTRRALLAGVGATVSTTALAIAIVPTRSASEASAQLSDPKTVGLTGLPLAAVHIERAVAALADPGLAGRWQVTINSGDADQSWGFRQIDADERAATEHTGRYDDLSFVTRKVDGAGFDYWNVANTGSYAADCDLGHRLAEEYLAYIGKHPTNGNATLLSGIVDSMMARRREPRTKWGRHTTGVEIAFLGVVNKYALATAAVVGGYGIA